MKDTTLSEGKNQTKFQLSKLRSISSPLGGEAVVELSRRDLTEAGQAMRITVAAVTITLMKYIDFGWLV